VTKQAVISRLASALLVSAVGLGALASCGVEEEATQANEPTNEPTKGAASATAASGPSTNALTWHLIARENCFDVWGRACDGTHPTGPRCSTAVDGQPCTTAIASCYKVANPWFTEFECS
jgi:hypothetical protein